MSNAEENSNGRGILLPNLLLGRIFLTVFLTYAVFVNFFGWNESSGLNLTRSIADEGRLEIDSYCNLPGADARRFYEFTGDRAYFNEHFYSTRAPLGPIIAIPAYVTYRTFYQLRYGDNIASKGFSEEHLPSVYMSIVASTSCLLGALLALLIFDFSRHYITSIRLRVFATFLFSFGTLVFNFGTVAFPHTPSAFFVFLSFYLLFEINSPNGNAKIKERARLSSFLSAVFFGCAVLHHFLIAAMSPAFLLYTLLGRERKTIVLPWLLGGLLSVSLFGFYNYGIFGTPFDWTQNHDDNRIFSRSDTNSDATKPESLIKTTPRISWTISDRLFQVFKRITIQRMVKRSTRLLVYPYRGLLFYNPILIFAFIGLFLFYKEDRLLVCFISLAFGLALFFNALHTDWWGGGSFGPRFLVPTIPLLFIGVIAFIRRLSVSAHRTWWLAAFVIFSLFNFLVIASGLRDWSYIVGAPADNNASIIINSLRAHRELMLSFSPYQSPLFSTYIPSLFSEGVKSVVLEGIYGSSWIFPRNVLYLAGTLVLIWIPVERIKRATNQASDGKESK